MSERRLPNILRLLDNLPARLNLYLLSLTCVIVSFCIRSVINIAILAMVKESNVSESDTNNDGNLCFLNNKSTVKTVSYGGMLEWSFDAQYYVLTAFYWTYIVSQVVGAIAAHKYGSKAVIGAATLTSSICNICIPFGSSVHYGVVILVQLINGFAQGLVWPAMYSMFSCWIPLQEKGRYVTCFQGLSLGVALSNLQSGYIIAHLNWRYAFYVSGIFGIVWSLCWYILAFDAPELHPKISVTELTYIKANREQILHTRKRKVPWVSMLCSLPLWANALASFGRTWVDSVVVVYGPMYLKTIIGLEVQMNGTMLSVISLATFLTALIISYLSDKLETHRIIPTSVNRKLFTGIGNVVSGLLCISMNYLNCNVNVILMVWAVIPIFLAFSFNGTMVNIVDIAPNFAGHVTSLIQIVLMTPSIFSTYVAKSYLRDGSTIDNWKSVFNVSAGVTFTCYFIYVIFGTAKVQKWDTEVQSDIVQTEEDELKELRN